MKSLVANLAAVLTVLAALKLTAAAPSALKQAGADAAPTNEITNSLGMKLVLIPAGEFLMGSGDSGEKLAAEFPQYERTAKFFADELPRHRVRITRPLYFGRHEVTVGQFKRFVEATGYKTQAEREEQSPLGSGGWGFNAAEQKFEGRDPKYNWRNSGFPVTNDMPVVNVTWNDAVAFCKWLSKKEGQRYRLPTEAEWEYAARAGTKTRYWPGDEADLLAKFANTADADFFARFPNYYPHSKTISTHDGKLYLAPVGSYPPNNFGLHDVHGNVWEWTADWYGEDYYSKSPTDDPKGAATGDKKVRRGGAWHTAPLFTRVSFRNYNTLDSRYPNLGFRIVQESD